MQIYTDPKRATDPHALPDCEVWFHSHSDPDCRKDWPEGFYWWPCSPGCLPDSDPIGPFKTEADAINDATRGD